MKPTNILPDTHLPLSKLFEGFYFSSPTDAWLAATVVGWIRLANDWNPAKDEPFRPPLVIISGPPACGKTALAARMVELAIGPGEKFATVPGDCVVQGLNEVAARRLPALLVKPVSDKVDSSLEASLVMPSWSCCPLGQRFYQSPPLHHVTMMTLPHLAAIGGDLARRCVLIRLDARPVVKPEVKVNLNVKPMIEGLKGIKKQVRKISKVGKKKGKGRKA